MNDVTNAPGIADPLLATIRSDDRSYRLRTRSGRSRIRCSMIGTANSASQRCSAIVRSVCSASNRRISDSSARSAMPSCIAASPQLWNSGAATAILSLARNGIRDKTVADVLTPFGVGRRAPFGAPVVPDVSTTIRPSRSLGFGRVVGASWSSSSSVR